MGDGQGEAYSDSSVNGVPTGFEDIDTDICGVRLDRHDHGAACMYRPARAESVGGRERQERG